MMYSWLKTVLPVAAIFAFRMLGLFMLIPVFTIYAPKLQDATPLLMGFALGAYGLSQGLLQIPFGMLSDRFGRKTMLSIGLLLFASGSLLGAFSTSIYTLILARTLQGTGAVGSVLIALLADLTEDKQRTKAMAVIGLTIGLSFSLAMLLSPIIAEHYGLGGIFYFTAILAVFGLILLHAVIPAPIKTPFERQNQPLKSRLKAAISNRHLLHLNAGIFAQHCILTATFFPVPLLLQAQILQGNLGKAWHFYLPVLALSFIAMLPFIALAEKKRRMKGLLITAVAVTSFAQMLLAFWGTSWLVFCGGMFIYFIAFNLLEASLPSLVSRQAPLNNKGTAMGLYSSCQFLGIFAGGALAGFIYPSFGNQGIFLANGLLALFWFANTFSMQPYSYLTTLSFVYPLQKAEETQLITRLKKISGVQDIVLEKDAGRIHLLINKSLYQEGSAESLIF